MDAETFFAGDDLSVLTGIFRKRLIEEFQLLDSIVESTSTLAPQYSNPKTLKKILLDNPNQLIKFEPLRRVALLDEQVRDRRLNRTKNQQKLPVGVWAASVIRSTFWQYFILALIVLNAVTAGLEAQWSKQRTAYWQFFQAVQFLNLFGTLIFMTEIALKWTDDFYAFFEDSWNWFDLILTILTAIPDFADFTSNTSAGLAGMRVLRVFRVLRLVSRFDSLKVLALTIGQTFESMAVILLLIMVAGYIFAIVGYNLFSNASDSTSDFSSLGGSLFQTFRIITYDSWIALTYDVMKNMNSPLIVVWSLLWLWLGGFILRNIFTGVVVTDFQRISDRINEKKAEYEQRMKFERMRRKLNQELSEIAQTKGGGRETVDNKLAPKLQNMARPEEMSSMEQIALEQEWSKLMDETVQGLVQTKTRTLWHRDTLFKYLQLMENLQENMKEYEELMSLLNFTLLDLQNQPNHNPL